MTAGSKISAIFMLIALEQDSNWIIARFQVLHLDDTTSRQEQAGTNNTAVNNGTRLKLVDEMVGLWISPDH